MCLFHCNRPENVTIFRYKLLLEQLHKTCSNAAAAVSDSSSGGDCAAAAAAMADSVNFVDEATVYINERKRDAGKQRS